MKTTREIVQGSMEDGTTPEAILTFLRCQEGKLVGKVLLDKLKEHLGRQDLYLKKDYGMCHLEWGNRYDRTSKEPYGSLLLAHKEVDIRVDSSFVEERNPAYFAGLRERNRQRQELLMDDDALKEMDLLLQIYQDAKKRLNDLMEYGKPFHVVCHDLAGEGQISEKI